MSLNPQSYLKAAYPLAPHVPGEFKRFVLRWNSKKVKGPRMRSAEWQECQGILFDAHDALVRIALSNGQTFITQAEMEHVLSMGGDFHIEWVDKEI